MADASWVRKGFVAVAGRQVHYRAAGIGPPVVLLHDSPRSSAMHEALLRAWSDEFTVIAIDTPGYGNSDPLPREPRPEISDFSNSLAATLAALGIERCPVYGFHTSSKITLQLAIDHPKQVSLALMDGLNLPPGGPSEAFIERYMKPFVLTDDGSYLAATWARARDLFRFFPWFDTSPQTRLPLDFPEPEFLHGYVLDMLMSGEHYSAAYSAAMRYLALERIPQLKGRALFTCRDNDPLYPFLKALPEPLPAGAGVEPMGSDPMTWRARIKEILRGATTTASLRLPPEFSGDSAALARGYVSLPHGQLHLRRWGQCSSRRPVLVLPELPGSAAGCDELARHLGVDRHVFVVDLPGIGESTSLPDADLAALTQILEQLLDALSVESVDVYAQFTAAPLALALARRRPAQVAHLLLDGVPLLGANERQNVLQQYCPPLPPRSDGAHLLTLWHQLRDQELSWPWYSRSLKGIRRRRADLTAVRLSALTLDLAKQLAHYGDAALASLGGMEPALLAGIAGTKANFLADAADPRDRGLHELLQSDPRATLLERPATAAECAAAALQRFAR
mgnify:CR=1 FL=1